MEFCLNHPAHLTCTQKPYRNSCKRSHFVTSPKVMCTQCSIIVRKRSTSVIVITLLKICTVLAQWEYCLSIEKYSMKLRSL